MARVMKQAAGEVPVSGAAAVIPLAAWNVKSQEVPKGSTWTLRGDASDMVLHEGISATNAPHLLRGPTSAPLKDVKLGEDISIELDGKRYKLQRTA